jgi:replicative DNA helicase
MRRTAVSTKRESDASIPYDQEAERAVIGALLLAPATLGDVVEVIRPEDFHRPALQDVYRAIISLDAKREVVDASGVILELKRAQGTASIEGSELISMLADAPSPRSILGYANRMVEASGKRGIIRAARSVAEYGHDFSVPFSAALDASEAELFSIRRDQLAQSRSFSEGLVAWEEAAKNRGDGIAHPLGWRDLDRALGGLMPSRLMILGARPGAGKTSLAGAMTLNVAKRGSPVLFVSIEMSEQELLGRFVATESRMQSDRVSQSRLTEKDWPHITPAIERLLDLPIQIEDRSVSTLAGVRSAARKAMARFGGLGLIIVDYLQLMTAGGRKMENRQVEVSELSRGLKMLAREMEIPVVALSQLNRGTEIRGTKTPTLSDLRESGAIEQDADQVVMIYRDELYNENSTEQGIARIIVAKNRHGSTGTFRLSVDMATGRWSDLASDQRF